MISEHFHSNSHTGQQLYVAIEHCRKPEILWARLATGNYDWLGMRRDDRFVLGRPRLTSNFIEEGVVSGGSPARHRIEHRAPLDTAYRFEEYPNSVEARSAFDRIVRGYSIAPLRSSGIWWVRLMIDDKPAEDRLVVRTMPIVD